MRMAVRAKIVRPGAPKTSPTIRTFITRLPPAFSRSTHSIVEKTDFKNGLGCDSVAQNHSLFGHDSIHIDIQRLGLQIRHQLEFERQPHTTGQFDRLMCEHVIVIPMAVADPMSVFIKRHTRARRSGPSASSTGWVVAGSRQPNRPTFMTVSGVIHEKMYLSSSETYLGTATRRPASKQFSRRSSVPTS